MLKSPARAGRPPKGADRRDARELLLNAAHELMTERQTIDVSVLDIARRVHLNPALINYHFGGKDALFLELAMRNEQRIERGIERLSALKIGAEVKLLLHIGALIRAYRELPYLQRLHHKILRDSDEAAAKKFATALVKPLAEFYRIIIEQGVSEGKFRRVDPMFLYVTIIGACDMFFSGRSSLRYGFDVESISEEAVDAYIEHTSEIIMNGITKSGKK